MKPTKVGVALVDVVTGLHAAIGIQAVLRHRDRTGEGQLVEVNLLSSVLAALTDQASAYVLTGAVPRAMGNAHPSVAPYQPLQTADRPLAVAATTDRQFRYLAEAVGRGDLLADERFVSSSSRVTHREELVAELEAALRTETADYWFTVLGERGVPCGPINDLGQAFELAPELGLDPVVHPEPGHDGRSVAQVRSPITLSLTPVYYRLNPPDLGVDGTAVGAVGWL